MNQHCKKICSIFLIFILCLGLLCSCGKKKVESQPISATPLAQGELENVITTMGTIASANSQDVATSLGEPIETVNVKVGDVVTAGQLLCTINTTALKDKLTQAKKTLTDAQVAYNSGVERATRHLADTQNQQYIDEQNAMQTVTQARDAANAAFNAACESEAAAYVAAEVEAQYNATATSGSPTYKKNVDDAITALNTAVSAMTEAEIKYAAVQAGVAAGINTQADLDAAKQALDAAVNEKNTKQAAYDAAFSAAESYKANLTASLKAQKLQKLQSGAESTPATAAAKTAMDTAQTNYNKAYTDTYPTNDKQGSAAIRADHMAVESAKDALTDAQRNTSAVDAARLAVKTLQDQIERAQIKAPISGTITVCNAVPDLIKADVLFTISNAGELQASGLLNEYDATRVSAGLSAKITSDALGETVMKGTVKLVAPKAEDAAGNFRVTVKIDNPPSEVKEGMTAKIRIVLQSAENCFYVATDSIGTDENGNMVVYVVDDATQKTTAVQVEPGIVNDYYTQITATDGTVLTAGMSIADMPDLAGATA